MMTAFTEEDQANWEAWIADRPESLRDWLTATMPRLDQMPKCWRLANTSGHYVVVSFHTEVDQATGRSVPGGGEVTLKVRHVPGPGGRIGDGTAGVTVFGVPAADLVPCGCGDFSMESTLSEQFGLTPTALVEPEGDLEHTSGEFVRLDGGTFEYGTLDGRDLFTPESENLGTRIEEPVEPEHTDDETADEPDGDPFGYGSVIAPGHPLYATVFGQQIIEATLRDAGLVAYNVEGIARAILARLTRNDPPILLCTPDEMKD